MNLNHAYAEPPSPEEGGRLLNRALDLGCSFLDTAALYGLGENERLLGNSVMHRKAEFTLASKCVMFPEGGERRLDGRPEAIKKSVEASLRRLRTEVIDLCYLHRLDRNVPVEDSMGALAELHAAGKIRAAGVSEMSATSIRRAHATFPVAAVQTEYSPWSRNAEVAVLDTCRELGISYVAFSPLGRGFLAGAIKDDQLTPGDLRLLMPRFVQPNLDPNLKVLEDFKAVAHKVGCTPAQLSLAWVLARGDDIVPIPGTRSTAHLEDNLAAAGILLSADIVTEIDRIFAPGRISGNRYSPAMQEAIDTELLPEEQVA
jgi:aryl-alcohol dehydrogenase-like predicted oxidoreductase